MTILKIASAELTVVFNDGIKTFAGSLWLDKKDEIGEDKRLPKNSNANCAACSHAPTKCITGNDVALQNFLSRRGKKEDYGCT